MLQLLVPHLFGSYAQVSSSSSSKFPVLGSYDVAVGAYDLREPRRRGGAPRVQSRGVDARPRTFSEPRRRPWGLFATVRLTRSAPRCQRGRSTFGAAVTVSTRDRGHPEPRRRRENADDPRSEPRRRPWGRSTRRATVRPTRSASRPRRETADRRSRGVDARPRTFGAAASTRDRGRSTFGAAASTGQLEGGARVRLTRLVAA